MKLSTRTLIAAVVHELEEDILKRRKAFGREHLIIVDCYTEPCCVVPLFSYDLSGPLHCVSSQSDTLLDFFLL